MKTIEQLIDLTRNPYYKFSAEEQAEIDAFLSQNSAQPNRAKKSTKDSEKNIPATVLNKNVVQKETGQIITINNVVDEKTSETEAVEELVHPDAVK